MPTNVPTIDDKTPGHLTVYIESPADDSVGTCTVDQYRELYKARGWKLTTPDAHRDHMAVLASETNDVRANRPDLLYADAGGTAAQRATSRSTTTSKEA